MNQNGDAGWLVLALIVAPIVYYRLQVARRKREIVRRNLRRVAMYFGCVLLGVGVIPKYGYSIQEAAIFSMFVGTTAALLIHGPRTDRRIPRKTRRKVIARFEATGERFDPKLHDVDHIVPFAKGGDHSEINLRVVPRSANRRRGARMPKFRDFF
jgi:hypothetical protein